MIDSANGAIVTYAGLNLARMPPAMRDLFFGNGPIGWVQELFGLGHPLPFTIFSLIGDTWGMILVVGIALWLFGREAFRATLGIVVASAATKVLLLSLIFSQSRPQGPGIVVYEQLEVSSFPSGHVYHAFAPWALLWLLGCVRLWIPVTISLLVALGRLYLGTHYLGDLIAGIVFGALLVWLYWKGWPAARQWFARRGSRFYRGLAIGAAVGTVALMVYMGGNARRFEIYGMVLAAVVALPIQHAYLDEEWGRERGGALRVVIGVAGIVALLLWDRSGGDQALLLGSVTAGLATLWALVGAPAVFRLLGLGPAGPDQRVAMESAPSVQNR